MTDECTPTSAKHRKQKKNEYLVREYEIELHFNGYIIF